MMSKMESKIIYGILILMLAILPGCTTKNNTTKEESNIMDTLIKQLNCEVEILENIKSEKEITKLYEKELSIGKEKGYIPVIIIPSEILYETIEYSDSEYDREIAIEKSKSLNAEQLIETYLKEKLPNKELDEIKGKFVENGVANYFTTIIDYDTNKPYEKMILAKIPTKNPWEIAAWVPMGGFYGCPDPEEQVAVFKYWYEKYSVFPALVSYDTWELFVKNPPHTEDDSMKLAVEQFAFCGDIVWQGTDDIGTLAGTLKDSSVWYFWWD